MGFLGNISAFLNTAKSFDLKSSTKFNIKYKEFVTVFDSIDFNSLYGESPLPQSINDLTDISKELDFIISNWRSDGESFSSDVKAYKEQIATFNENYRVLLMKRIWVCQYDNFVILYNKFNAASFEVDIVINNIEEFKAVAESLIQCQNIPNLTTDPNKLIYFEEKLQIILSKIGEN